MASQRVRVVMDELGQHVERVMRRLLLRCFQSLTSATPVDTGFARAGWSPSIGAPNPGPDLPAGSGAAARDVASQQAQQLFGQHSQVAQQLAAGYRLSQGPVFIVNGVRYVTYLNQGTSAQAPAMFVEQAIAQAVAATRRELGGS